jgi:signal transduction histidine kinase
MLAPTPASTRSPQPSPPAPQTPADTVLSPVHLLAEFWPGVVFRQRPDLTFEFVTPPVEALTGVAPSDWQRAPSRFWDMVHEQDAERVRGQIERCVQTGLTETLGYRVCHLQHGRVSHVLERRRARWDGHGQLLGYDGLWVDQTRQITAEQRLASAGWKETLAVLTMGLAHDFNNILAAICSLSDTYLGQIDAQHPFHEGLSLIHRKAWQASQLVNRIVSVHRGKTGVRSYQDLNEIVRDALDLMRQVLPRHIGFTTDLSAAALPLYVDAVEFQQVIINLTLNAVDAIPEQGQLRFVTRLCDQLPELQHAAGIRPRTPCACLSISDTGGGIKAPHLEAIFEPFFTTKAMSQRSGVGLYHARQFVEKHQGLISLESVEGAGTTIHVWLPQADFTEADQAEQLRSRRRRSVLLVGPAGPARAAMAESLRQQQFQVFAITGGGEDWLQSPEYSFDGLILQVEARDLEAHSLIRFVRQHSLPVKVVLQLLGGPQDSMETQFLFQADLVLPPELPTEEMLAKLQRLFDT